MTDILTESFCERCGTRYTFESAAPRRSGIGRVKAFSKGVRNFVLSDDASFSEAMADARSELELTATAHQLDAFHRTFNFCLNCRQYTCGSCWNGAEGRCLPCAPDAALDAARAEAEAAEVARVQAEIEAAEGARAAAEAAAAELARVQAEAEAAESARAAAEAEAVEAARVQAEAEAVELARVQAEAEAVEARAAEIARVRAEAQAAAEIARVQAEIEAAEARAAEIARVHAEIEAAEAARFQAEAEAAEVARAVAATSIRGLTGGQSLEEAIAAWEADQAGDAAGVTAPPPEPTPEPALGVAATAAPGPKTRADDIVPQPGWPVSAVAPAAPPPPTPSASPPESPVAPPFPWLTTAPDDAKAEPRWPARPAVPTRTPNRDAPATLAGRTLLPQHDDAALWAASAREVLDASRAQPTTTPAAPQPCVRCGLSLSANARFCRRCGAPQG